MSIDNSKINKCYWCGEAAISDEHVPPQNLFPQGYKNNLTVRACREHNERFSKLDERMRFHMVLMGDLEIARKHFEGKVIRGLKRKEGLGLAIDLRINQFTDYNNKEWQGEKSDNFQMYFEKIIRGIFYYHYGLHIVGSTSFFSNKMPLVNMTADAHFYYYLIEDRFLDRWVDGDSKNKDIFDYKYYYFDVDKQFFIIMRFYREHEVIGVTLPEGKTIDDYGITYEEFISERNKMKNARPFLK